MKSGFVSIFGKPNAGKSTLLNALLGEKLAIVSHKVQTTRHRIRGILSGEGYQAVISDTPGIIEPKYRLHEKMMGAVKGALEDADLALLLVDAEEKPDEADALFSQFSLKVPAILVLNKVDEVKAEKLEELKSFFASRSYAGAVMCISALKKTGVDELLKAVVEGLPEGVPFFEGDELTDLPTRFFVGEMVREKIFELVHDEIPYHTTVVVQEFTEKISLTKIRADIIVQRESQKAILLGEKGSMIRNIGSAARQDIEAFLDRKVFLELFIKVRPKWRDNDLFLREYGYS